MDDILAARRPPSIRSVASNNSVASAVSLTRRPRTRPRSRTVTGASSTRAESPQPGLPLLDKPIVQEPLSSTPAPDDPQMPPPRSLDVGSSATPSTQNTELAGAETTFVDPQHSPELGKTPTKARLGGKSSLPAIHTRYQPPPSAFSRDPAHIPNVRDSVSTHQSGASSSLYPLSSSTMSGPESPPSPRSMSEQFDHHLDSVRIDADPMSVQEFDSDDVAYRLQLLVKNNYFLPPAHSKPSPSDFAALAATANPKKQAKSSTPAGILDLFRSVKPKSKPTTPTGSPHIDSAAPMLRATSDSITAPHSARVQQQPKSSLQNQRIPPRPASRGRVVVVREKMGDIMVAAKQAEQDLKNKGVRLDQVPQLAVNQDSIFDDVVDPTDAVDIPLPSASYPFAVQASALHGLGVQDSLGADVLADRLPPPQSPNQSSSYEADNHWRKALLHQAVERSLDNTPDISTFSHALGVSTPVQSVRRRSKSAAPTPDPSHRRGGVFEEALPEPRPKARASHDRPKLHSASSSPVVPHTLTAPLDRSFESRSSSYIPPRVETPVSPMTILSPPPRRQNNHPLQSTSQTDLPSHSKEHLEQRPHSSASRHTLRRAQSSPMLADLEPISRRGFAMTPPPPMPHSQTTSRIPSARTTMSFETVRSEHMDSGSIYSDDELVYAEGAIPRNSLALSAIMSRPSLSEYSQDSFTPSPTTSAFQDALNHRPGYHSSSSSLHNRSRVSLERGRDPYPGMPPRDSTISPPPRISSSLAHFAALPPPPRSGHQAFPRSFLRPQSVASTASTEPASDTIAVDDTIQFHEPEPTTPPVPSSELPYTSHGLSLDIPRLDTRVDAAEPSPTAFFDSMEDQPNAMDDLESSDESDDDGDRVTELMHHPPSPLLPFSPDQRVRTTSTASAPVSRAPPMMKFGNSSLPYVSKHAESMRTLPIGIGSGIGHEVNKQPVGNVPAKPRFFTDRKSDSDHAPPSSTYDFYRYAQSNQSAQLGASSSDSRSSFTAGRPSFAGTFSSLQSAQSEEAKKLDGMLLQHMEAEKDTIKRIATSVKNSVPPPPELPLVTPPTPTQDEFDVVPPPHSLEP
ncbi:hypothetical protein D9611_001547 [Ephemerocybe angulata]|uniref:Uncharacterized protein n=1 Tax=Ephemerocybe angulata TaxID=980116 RepID=A0A8H5FMU5_9AGAR|nr:hypothetical protein D9611_001547 [Tulosesus angulatus]